MDSYCRLCAKIKSPAALKHNLSDITFKLLECCRWEEPITESEYPQNVCDPCYKRLDQSWRFSEKVKTAQKELDDLIVQQKNVEILVSVEAGTVSAKEEPDLFASDIDYPMSEIVAPSKTEFFDFGLDPGPDIDDTSGFEWPDTNADDWASGDFEASDRSDGDHDDIKDNTIDNDTSNDGELNQNEERKKCNVMIKRQEFIEQIAAADRLEDGKINPERVITLKVCDWRVFKYKCSKCGIFFDNTEPLKKHFAETHANDTLQWMCTICPKYSATKFLWQLHTHVANQHYPHLFYW